MDWLVSNPFRELGALQPTPENQQDYPSEWVSNPFRELGALQPGLLRGTKAALATGFKPLSGIGCVATESLKRHAEAEATKFQTPFGNWVRCNFVPVVRTPGAFVQVSNPFRELGALQPHL